METNKQLIEKLLKAIVDCTDTLASPLSKKEELNAHHDKVLGLVSTCNVRLKDFSEEERLQFDNLYDKATTIASRTRKFILLMK
jgi:peroxiredoxin